MSKIPITVNDPRLLTSGEPLAVVLMAENAALRPHDPSQLKAFNPTGNRDLRAENLTDLLQKISAIHPESHWGINE